MAARFPGMPMELWSSLKEDHRNLAASLEQMRGRRDLREGLVREWQHAAEAHFRGEEETVFPALREIPGFAELVTKAAAQHAAMRRLIEQLATGDETEWPGRAAELQAVLHAYIEDEEEKIIDCGRHQLPAHVVEQLKHRFMAAKKSAIEETAP